MAIKTAEASIARNECEYEIPFADAEALLEQREGAISTKVRHVVPHGGVVWEIDASRATTPAS